MAIKVVILFKYSHEFIQQRFLLRKSGSSTDTKDYRWWVPLTYTSNFNEPQKSAWLNNTQTEIKINDLGATNDEWVIFNVGQVLNYYVIKCLIR